jgi:hypothetical protein
MAKRSKTALLARIRTPPNPPKSKRLGRLVLANPPLNMVLDKQVIITPAVLTTVLCKGAC